MHVVGGLWGCACVVVRLLSLPAHTNETSWSPECPPGPWIMLTSFMFSSTPTARCCLTASVPSIVLRVSRMLDVMFDMVF